MKNRTIRVKPRAFDINWRQDFASLGIRIPETVKEVSYTPVNHNPMPYSVVVDMDSLTVVGRFIGVIPNASFPGHILHWGEFCELLFVFAQDPMFRARAEQAVRLSSIDNAVVKCEKCETAYETKVWRIIDTRLNPEIKNTILDNSAFEAECPTCGNRNCFDHSLLYYQAEDQTLLYFGTSPKSREGMRDIIRNAFVEDDKLDPDMRSQVNLEKMIQIVDSRYELSERILILEKRLDERVIELYKQLMIKKLKDFLPEKPYRLFLRINNRGVYNEEYLFEVIKDDIVTGFTPFEMNVYKALERQYSERT